MYSRRAMIRNWLRAIAPIGRADLESPIKRLAEAPPPSPATTSAEIVFLHLPPPSPASVITQQATHAVLDISGSNAAIRLVPAINEHANAIYMKTKFMNFIERVMKKDFSYELLPDFDSDDQMFTFKGPEVVINIIIKRFLAMIEPDCPPEHYNRIRLLADPDQEDLDPPLGLEIEHGCFFVRAPGLWVLSFADRWTVVDSHEAPDLENISEFSFIIGAPEVLDVREFEGLNVRSTAGEGRRQRKRLPNCCIQ